MSRNSRLLPGLLAAVIALPNAAHAAPLPTVTTLAISSSSAASPAAVTLTASVVAGGAPVTTGTVTFCDASVSLCEDAAMLGRAQLAGTNATATFKFIPAIGVHAYKAIFSATATAATSTSNIQTLTVTGLHPTTTSIAASGNPSGYQLTATVVGFANQPPTLSGAVSFQDTSNGNFVLGTASLGAPGPAVESFVPAAGSPIPTGNQPAAGASADFNGDGIPDLAIMDSYQNAITVLLGNGDGTFRAANGSPINGVGSTPCSSQYQASNCSMAVGDFNHDGKADLAETSDFDNTVIILLGNGDGTFTPASGSPITVGNFPEAVAIGDFNNDGVLDLAVANANDNTVSILLGNGDGTFTAAAAVPTGGFPFYLAVADFNRDGAADIAVSNEADSTVSVLLGNGDGTFTQTASSPIPGFNYNPAQIVAADFNGDGYPDLAVADFIPVNQNPPVVNRTSNVVVMLGNPDGSGTFTPAPGSPITVGLYALALVAADFNQDGHTDLAVDNYGVNTTASTQTLAILMGDGKGGFTQPLPTTQLGNSPNALIAADFNGDGTTDLAIPNVGEFDTTILLNEFTQTATASISNVTIAGTATHYVDAVYAGNTSFASSTSSTVPLEGLQVNTSLTLTANPAEQMLTMPVTFTARLASLSNETPFANPTGTVSFFDQSLGGQLLGTAAMGANGQAVFTTTAIGPGTHVISASYAGDATFLPSSSNQITEQIDDLLINRVGNNNTTIMPGTTVSYTLQVTPAVATKFLYTVGFSASGLPAGASASFSPPTLAAGSTTAKITMTVTTATTSFNAPPPSPFGRLPLALGVLLPLFGSKAMRRRMRMRKVPPLPGVALLAALGLAAVAGLSGCSGAGLFAAKKVPYSITVTATEGTLQRSTTVPLGIQ
jgi:hypothetical protein